MRSLPTKNADATLKQFDLCLDMQEAHEDVLDTSISSYYLQVCACLKIRSLGNLIALHFRSNFTVVSKRPSFQPTDACRQREG